MVSRACSRERARARVRLGEPCLLARMQLAEVGHLARRMARTRAFQVPRGACTSTTSPTPAPISAMPERRVGRDAADRRDLDLHRLAVLVLDLDDGADADVLDAFVLDGHRVVQPVLQQGDATLDHPLLVLGRVILEVLGEVAELAGALDRFDDLRALGAFELASSASRAARCCGVRCSAFGPLTRERLTMQHIAPRFRVPRTQAPFEREKGGEGGDRPGALRRSGRP